MLSFYCFLILFCSGSQSCLNENKLLLDKKFNKWRYLLEPIKPNDKCIFKYDQNKGFLYYVFYPFTKPDQKKCIYALDNFHDYCNKYFDIIENWYIIFLILLIFFAILGAPTILIVAITMSIIIVILMIID